jgi:small subunit ribosomal protein S6
MRHYETGFLIVPNLPDDELETLIDQMASIVTKNKGEMEKIDRWGKRKTAYQIQKFNEAVYVFFHYTGEPDIPVELERQFKQKESVIRYLTLKKDLRENIRDKKKLAHRRAQRRKPIEEPKAPPAKPEKKPEEAAESKEKES